MDTREQCSPLLTKRASPGSSEASTRPQRRGRGQPAPCGVTGMGGLVATFPFLIEINEEEIPAWQVRCLSLSLCR